ncbi:Kelch domain-containing protein 8A-like [Oopsacas minuta]|uniref:Kelch domain-containing protein 8A-like n=1 Tax=Oopsacas minuta TaxID=111878 RepID=A0AAV7JSV0_9METZ|nr:Kelch domain-containing protein 8A-like [Oopsacas minuta]
MATSNLSSPSLDIIPQYKISSFQDIPKPRVYCSVCSIDKRIFVIGGCDSKGKSLNTTFVYSESCNWEIWPKIPRNRSASTLVLTNNSIFLIGGVDENQNAIIEVDSLNFVSQIWRTDFSLPVGVVGCGAFLYDNKIFVVAGATTDNISQRFFGYFDILNCLWVNLPDIPTARYAMSTYVYDDFLYVIGGRDVLKPMVEIEAFDLKQSIWKTLPSIPSRRAYSCTLGYKKYIYHIGGVSEGVGTWKPNVRKLCERFDISTSQWVKLKPLKYRRTDFAACIIMDKVIVAGGVSEQNDQLVPISDAELYSYEKDKWESIVSLSIPRCSISCCSYLAGMLIIGGMGPGGPQKKVEFIQISS